MSMYYGQGFIRTHIASVGLGLPTPLLVDRFPTAESAPLASPRTCSPGPGSLTIVDTGNKLSIAPAGWLKWTGAPTVNNTDPRLQSVSSFARIGGLCAMFQRVGLTRTTTAGNQYCNIGFADAAGTFDARIGGPGQNTIFYSSAGQILNSLTVGHSGSTDRFYLICRGISGYFYIFGRVLLAVSLLGTLDPVYFRTQIGQTSHQLNFSFHKVAVAALPDYLWGGFGSALQVFRFVTSGAGIIRNSLSDGTIECQRVFTAAETFDLTFRRGADDGDRWIVRCDQAGSTIKLIERVGSVDTERASAAYTWTVGNTYRIVVNFWARLLSVSVNDLFQIGYNAAITGLDATGTKTSHAVTEYIAWYSNLPESAAHSLDLLDVL